MERAEILSKLRGDSVSPEYSTKMKVDWTCDNPVWKEQALQRFPASFVELAPENAQRMILWCLERTPSRRPSAEDLLSVSIAPILVRRKFCYLIYVVTP